jgi:hypothetical protein
MKVIRGLVVDDNGKPLPNVPQLTKKDLKEMAQLAASGASMVYPPIGIPLGAYEAYQGYANQDPIQGLLGGLTAAGGVAGTIAKAPGAALKYAEGQRKMSPVNINIEATSPNILQKASETGSGRALSDLRYGTAQQGAAGKGMEYANIPPSKAQGVWIDPTTGAEEFNRVYSQNLGPINRMNIQKSGPLSQYAQSMGGDLGQIGIGAARFTKIPMNLNKDAATGLLYENVTSKQIIEAGKKLNPKEIVVSATPNGGMLVFDPKVAFDPSNAINVKQLASELKGVAKSPKYGLLDSAYFDTSAAGQGAYMNPVDELLRLRGF